jgi:anti-anti-sigma factor
MHGAGGCVELSLGHHGKAGTEVVDDEGEIDVYSARQLRELLIDLVSKINYQIVVNLEKVGFLDSTGLGVLAATLTAPGQRGPVSSLTFSPDGKLLAIADGDGNIYNAPHQSARALKRLPDQGTAAAARRSARHVRNVCHLSTRAFRRRSRTEERD